MQKILVAEDSHALANLLEFVLENAGFEAHVFPTGRVAYEAAQKQRFDMLLLDQQMPEMTGIEVASAVRREEGPNQHARMFLCTAKTHELDLAHVRKVLNLTDIFHKPFSPKDLADRLIAVAAEIESELEPGPIPG